MSERPGEHRAPVERISSLPRFDFNVLGDEAEALGLSEAGYGLALGLNPQPGFTCFLVLTRR